jgi:hypothetical protein
MVAAGLDARVSLREWREAVTGQQFRSRRCRARAKGRTVAQAVPELAHDRPKLRALHVEINVRPFSLEGVLLLPPADAAPL